MKNITKRIQFKWLARLCIITFPIFPMLSLATETERPVLYLDQSEWDKSNFNVQTGCKLLRELVRQSVLVSAELDYGWIPRDYSFGEPEPADYEGPEFKLIFRFLEKESFTYQVSLPDQENEPLISETIPSSYYDVGVYQKVLALAEQQTRILTPTARGHNLSPETTVTNASNTSTGIANLDFLTVWQQLRALDRELREYGETPERLAGLARGYSTFGSLNYNLMCDIPKASLARGLVYAQRLVRTCPDSADAYYTRAYSWTLAGFTVFALEDLKKAKSLGGTPPEWLPVIEAYIDSDLALLQKYLAGDGFNAQLAGLFGAFATHNSDFTTRFFQFVKPASKKNPQNLQLYHLANDCMGGVSSRHWSSTTSFEELDTMIRTRLPIMEDIGKTAYAVCVQQTPPSAPLSFIERLFMDSSSRNPQPSLPIRYPVLYTALMEQTSADITTPSTALLANTIRDTLFTFSYYRLNFMKFWWCVDTSTAVDDLTKNLAGHPYNSLLEAFSNGADIPAFTKKTTLDDPGVTVYEMINGKLFRDIKPDFANMTYNDAYTVSWNNMDRNAFDIVPYFSLENNKRRPHYIKKPLAANPNHYAAVMFALWDKDLPTDSFIEQHANIIHTSAEATWRLGKSYAIKKQWGKARSMYEKSLAINPTRETNQALAALCLQQGDRDAWLKYMLASLDFPDNGLETAQTHRDIAKRLLYMGEWENAVPFAEAAARCGSDWGLNLAAWCNGLTGHAERSQHYLEQSAYHYDQVDYLPAYYATFGTQPGSEKIGKLIDSQYAALRSGNAANRQKAAAIASFRNDSNAAVTLLQQELERSNDPWNGVWAALICESEGWIEERDKILKEAHGRYAKLRYPSNNRKGLKGFVDLYIAINTSNELSDEQIHKITTFAKGYAKEGFNVDAHTFAGELLRLKEQEKLAQQLFIDIIKPHEQGRIVEFLPYRRLRGMGLDPVQLLREKYGWQTDQHE